MNLISRPRSIEYGFSRLAPSMERYRVPGSGVIWVSVEAGDRISVRDPEGGQTAEIAVLDASGRDDAAALSVKNDKTITGLCDTLRNAGVAAQPVLAELSRLGVDPQNLKAAEVMGGTSRPGSSQSFVAERSVTCIVAAPGKAMEPDQQTPPTALELTIERARRRNNEDTPLPAPLAEPRLDIRIDRRTAQAYEVEEGEYIQIIDVSGRQCSDLLVFDAKQLQQGVERTFDSTATRTHIGSAYPGPGLHSKFLDPDLQPLLEVVRDTVGRHDTFAFACNARGYEDIGYPGHVNCTDNMNAVLAPYGVTPRPGWPAINLFSNTGFTDDLQFYVDEPWTRPGDYVLVRASKSLVCSSSACPDEVNPTNGWNPTDIHVRVYPAQNKISRAIGYRMTPDSDTQLTQETAFHSRTSAITKNFSEYNGFWVPNAFNNLGAVKEYYACREKATIMDLSPLRKYEVLGPDAEELLQRTLPRDVRRMSDGQVGYTALCYESGGMIDDGTLFKFGANNFRWIGGNDLGGIWLREKAEASDLRVHVKTATDQLHNLAIQGPNSRDIVASAIWTPEGATSVGELKRFRFVVGRVGDFNGPIAIVSRTGYTGELGYEVWCHPKDAVVVWDALMEAGKDHGLTPMGMAALDMLRIEAGLVFAGHEFDDQTDPCEAGIGFVIDRKKDEDFVGKHAIEKRMNAPQRQLVGLEFTGNELVGHGDGVYVGRAKIGIVTSATRSPILKKSIAMARLTTEFSGPGTEVEVGKLDGHQRRLPATVTSLPFYDPERTRVRS